MSSSPSTSTSSSGSRERSVGQVVRERVGQFRKHTALKPLERVVSELDCEDEDLLVGELLGSGTFSRVYHASYKNVSFALKELDPTITHDPRGFKTASADLALEAELLERLDHENIITIYAVKSGSLTEAINNVEYFMLLDLLNDTLEHKLQRWRTDESERRRAGTVRGRQERMLSRVERSALGIVRGMEYLHRKGIIFRDLKPQNVGFDMRGTVKIFDFGIARDLHYCHKTGLTLGFAGTPRYMAPEVAYEGGDYNQYADVYSFGVLLWEICTLSKPFPNMSTLEDYKETVVFGDQRPQVEAVQDRELERLIRLCWHADPRRRPPFSEIGYMLEGILGVRPRAEKPQSLSLTEAMVDMSISDVFMDEKDVVSPRDAREAPDMGQGGYVE